MSTRNFSSRMKGSRYFSMFKMILVILGLIFISGCSDIPIKDGGLVVGRDTTASIEDLGVASLNSRF